MNVSSTTNKKKRPTRRECLTGGAALAAGVVLNGCGGGDDGLMGKAFSDPDIARPEAEALAELLADSNSLAAKAPSGTPVLNLNTTIREVYFIEVTFNKTRTAQVEVDLYAPGQNSSRIGFRSAGTSGTHEVQFATMDTAPLNTTDSTTTRDSFKNGLLVVVRMTRSSELPNPGSITVGNIGSRVTIMHSNLQRFMYSDHNETEWLASVTGTASPTNWDVAIRFFKASNAEMGSRRAALITEVHKSVPRHKSTAGLFINYPRLHNLPPESSAHVAGVVLASVTDGLETLVIPNHRHPDHFELIKPLAQIHTATTAKAHSHRRLQRHMSRFGSHLRSQGVVGISNIAIKGMQLHGELMKIMYGHTMARMITKAAYDCVDNIKAALDFSIDAGINDLGNLLNSLDSDANRANIERALQSAPRHKEKGTSGVSVNAGVSLQGKAEGKFVMPFFEVPSHGGVRASLLIANAAWHVLDVNGQMVTKTGAYSIKKAATEGYKLTLTGIVGPDTLLDQFELLSLDAELSVSMTIKRDSLNRLRCRVDSIMLDPVLDTNLRKFTSGLLEKALLKLYDNSVTFVTNGSPETISRPMTIVPSPAAWSSFTPFVNYTGGALLATTGAALAQVAIDAVKNTLRTWSLIEISLLRMGLFNSDSYDTFTGGFRSGFQGASAFAYTPAVKYLAGVGFEAKGAKYSGVFRILGNTSVALIYGTEVLENSVLKTPIP